jgi:hypothetical protein
VETQLWNIILTIALSAGGFIIKSMFDELKRVQILMNKTREEIAKEYVTKADMHSDINRVLARLDRLEEKLDDFMQRTQK